MDEDKPFSSGNPRPIGILITKYPDRTGVMSDQIAVMGLTGRSEKFFSAHCVQLVSQKAHAQSSTNRSMTLVAVLAAAARKVG